MYEENFFRNQAISDVLLGAKNLNVEVTELSDETALELINDIARRFIADRHRRFWWESLSQLVRWFDQETTKLSHLLPSTPEPVYLVCSDEREPPVFLLNSADVEEIVGETRLYEFFVLPTDLRWLIIDTHHNMSAVCEYGG